MEIGKIKWCLWVRSFSGLPVSDPIEEHNSQPFSSLKWQLTGNNRVCA